MGIVVLLVYVDDIVITGSTSIEKCVLGLDHCKCTGHSSNKSGFKSEIVPTKI